MQVYWYSAFLLPSSIAKECDRILRKFLWGGQGPSKVKWTEVCKPMAEGGLGIKDLMTWNRGLLLKQVRDIVINQSLWARWCHVYLIKQSNFWSLPTNGLHSWSWRQILLLRPVAKDHHIYKCGREDKFSLWFDPWMHGESVHTLYGHRVIHDSLLGRLALVKEVIKDGRWDWSANSSDLVDIQHRVQDIPISVILDSISWVALGCSFSTKLARQSIRASSAEVVWHRLVWHPAKIPKHAFCLWLAMRRAHRTRDKLLALEVINSASCVFNCGEVESLEHLFFHCPFSHNIWRVVLATCNILRPISQWMDEVQWMLDHARGHMFPALVRKLAFAASIYHIWLERNRRCFKNEFMPVQEIIDRIKHDVASKLRLGRKTQRCERHHSLCENWGIPLGEKT
ncbi:zf-RVT domain-containing protein [Cephalotus follicularis]|uniref:Zf-RVT domain-containing protein n=1 Tax=Cephalotus follicularis TaxID=3775 RepID=A0A1Q3C401_CEPFO|nr:zf-RVT domain-containing protein [Cephalotus follicularis]